MIKFFLKVSTSLILLISSIGAFSQNCQTGYACASSNNCTVSTYCAATNTFSVINIESPRVMYGGPGSYIPPAVRAMQNMQCRQGLTQYAIDKCKVDADMIFDEQTKACNTGVAIGATVAVAGGAGAAIIVLMPVTWPVIVVGSVVFAGISMAGTYSATTHQIQCKDTANSNKNYNYQACSNLNAIPIVTKHCNY